ncbi:MAG TPA: diacylglycerol kinase [Planctomycetaceae bacterium]|nr:diacylglycerol kinase [Planctomycetaceae bacterium]
MQQANWTLVVAVAQNGTIGRNGDLPWRLSSDLKRFKKMTMGHCLLMGRKTYESIGRPLPGRQTIVLSRRGCDVAEGIRVVGNIDEVQDLVEDGRQVMVVGGAQVYRSALKNCTRAWITRVLAEIEGDATFAPLPSNEWCLESTEGFPEGPTDEFPTQLEVWRRRADS